MTPGKPDFLDILPSNGHITIGIPAGRYIDCGPRIAIESAPRGGKIERPPLAKSERMTHGLHDRGMASMREILWAQIPDRLHGVEDAEESDVARVRVRLPEILDRSLSFSQLPRAFRLSKCVRYRL